MSESSVERPFRFFDNREKYLQFVTTCGEKWAIAKRVGGELASLTPNPPALRVFDAGMGDGTVLTDVLRQLHERFPTVPFLVVGKEISIEDVRMTLEKLPDRFAEHPQMVVAVTNLHYREAPHLRPETSAKQAALQWCSVALEGSSAHEFDAQITELQPLLVDWWQVCNSEKTGNPLYVTPSVLILYRGDQKFLLDGIVPQRGDFEGVYDLVIAAQPYRARTAADIKSRLVLEPLARALAPAGRMVVIQSTGQDPGMEIIRGVWPEETPFRTPAPLLMKALREQLRASVPERNFIIEPDDHELFRYALHSRPEELADPIQMSILLAAWNAAVYVAQIDDLQLAEAMTSGDYLEVTREVLSRHGGLWFIDESFVVEGGAVAQR